MRATHYNLKVSVEQLCPLTLKNIMTREHLSGGQSPLGIMKQTNKTLLLNVNCWRSCFAVPVAQREHRCLPAAVSVRIHYSSLQCCKCGGNNLSSCEARHDVRQSH
jgi:hypothetical protein